MGCGTSGTSVANPENASAQGNVANGKSVSNGYHEGDDDLPTVVLPDTPVDAKAPIAFEIPVEEFDGTRRQSSPPAHLQRLLQPPQNDISLPDIEEKLAVAEQRRLSILQQRAASAQKRTQKMIRSTIDMGTVDSDHEIPEMTKIGSNTLTIPTEPGVCEDKNIS